MTLSDIAKAMSVVFGKEVVAHNLSHDDWVKKYKGKLKGFVEFSSGIGWNRSRV